MTVWGENWEAVQLFSRFSTQWRMSAAGPVGLDYGVIQHELARRNLPDDQYDDLMGRLRVIEQAALAHIHEKTEPESDGNG